MGQKAMTVLVVSALAVLVVCGGGCQKWKEKYEMCTMDLEDMQASFDASQESLQQCNSSRDQLASQLASCKQQLTQEQTRPTDPTIAGEDAKWDAARGTLTVTLGSKVLFKAGAADLTSQAKQRLGSIAQEIRSKYGNKQVSVVGHTDSQPLRVTKNKWKDNWELSCERALAVTRQLVGQGIPAEQLEAAGRGEFHPLGTMEASRRVEIVVHMY